MIAAFLSGLCLDVLTTLVFHYTNINRTYHAATINVLANACIIFVFVDISANHSLAFPYLGGIWIGGILGIALKKKLESDIKKEAQNAH